jgi:hypothetical protein
VGALVVLVAVQVFVPGLYLPPVFKAFPPQMIISLLLHTAVCAYLPVGALLVLVGVQVFVPGSYLPPVFNPVLPS